MSLSKKYFIAYKPYGMLCQFTGEIGDVTLKDLNCNFPKDVYSVGRLDKDSEGLLLLTNDNRLKTKLLDPKSKKTKTYWVQVEGEVTQEKIDLLKSGTIIISHNKKRRRCGKAEVRQISEPNLPERNPPIRFRKNIPTAWLEIVLTEGKNRQVRKMTAKVDLPTLRLVRVAMANVELPTQLTPNEVAEIQLKEIKF